MDLGTLSANTNGLSLDALSGQAPTPIGSTADNEQHAMFTAVATSSQDNLISNYEKYKNSLEQGDDSPLKQDMAPLVQQDQATTAKAAASVLTDPSVPDDTKFQVPQYLQAKTDLSARQATVESMASSSNGNEGVNQENARLTIMSNVDSFLDYQRQSRALVKAMQVANDKSGSTVDTMLNFLPGLSGLLTTGIKQDVLKQDQSNTGVMMGMLTSMKNTADIRNYIDAMPPEKRMETLKQVLTYANNNNASLFDEANYASLNLARELVDNNDSSNEALVKDVLFDATYLIGGGAKKAAGAAAPVASVSSESASAASKYALGAMPQDISIVKGTSNVAKERAQVLQVSEVAKAVGSVVRNEVNPASLIQTAAAVNPTQGANLAKLLETSTEDVARVLTDGKPKADALVDLTMPNTTEGPIRVKPDGLDYSDDLVAMGLKDSGFRYSAEERAKQQAGLQATLDNAVGVQLRPEMGHIVSDSGEGFKINAVVTDGNTGFNSAKAAFDRTEYAMRDLGITRDSFQLMKRGPEGYSPIDFSEALPDGDYAVSINHNWGYDMKTGFTEYTPRFNLADSMKGLFDLGQRTGQGSITQLAISPTQIFHKQVTQPFIVAEAHGAHLTAQLTRMSHAVEAQVGKLPKAESKSLVEYIKRANVDGIKFDPAAMAAQGYSKGSIDAYREFKRFHDTAFVLENADKVKTLDSYGYGYVVDRANNSQLLGKPLARNAKVGLEVYDPSTNVSRVLTAAEKKDLYDNGGFISELKDHISVNGSNIKHVLVTNAQDNYFRKLNQMDRVLNYRDGYYRVQHNSPFFIVQNVKDKSGKLIYSKAVAEAASTKEAQMMGESLSGRTGAKFHMQEQADSDYFIRTARSAKNRLTAMDEGFDVGISAGRSSQKFRGDALESVNALASGQSQHVLNPLEAMQNTAQSLGNRVSLRPVIEGLKTRFMDQYGKYLPTNPKTHMKYIPNDPAELGKGMIEDVNLRHCRTTWAYINQMENGFVNGIDALASTISSWVADGVRASPTAEGAMRKLADTKLSSAVKGGVFITTLGMNTIGALLTQGSQSLSNLAFNVGIADLHTNIRDMLAHATGLGTKDWKDSGKQLFDEMRQSGLFDSIDQHYSEQMGGFSVHGIAGFRDISPTRPVASLLKMMQLGNTYGEDFNQLTAWLVKRSAWQQSHKGATPTLRELDQILAEAKSMTFNFSKAASYSYQGNTLSVSMQFFQMIHKAVTDPFLSRTVGTRDRLAMVAAPILLYGVPSSIRNTITDVADSLPDVSREDKDKFATAMEMSMMKNALSLVGVKGDFYTAKYNPMDAMGMASQLLELYQNGLPGLITKSPAGTLVTNRIAPAVKTFGQYLGAIDRDSNIPVSDEALWKAAANLSSGTSNAFKSYLMYHTGELRNNNGDIIQQGITPSEAFSKSVGLDTEDYQRYLAYGEERYASSQDLYNDMKTFVKNVNSELINNGMLKSDPQYVQAMVGSVLEKFKDTPKAYSTALKVLSEDAQKNGESSYLISTLRSSGLMPIEEMVKQARRIPDEDQRKQTLDLIYRMENGNQ